MIQAEYRDKDRVARILTDSFVYNKSVNYIVKADSKRKERIKRLMEYSFEVSYRFGKVFLSNDKKGCALIVLPDKKKISLRSILLDVRLMFNCFGLSNVRKAIHREARIKELQVKGKIAYLWFIGVNPQDQNKGIGSLLLSEIINDADSEKRIICLETSTLDNIPWYEKFGFMVYNQLDLDYQLFFLKK